jgi:hypothetical protein
MCVCEVVLRPTCTRAYGSTVFACSPFVSNKQAFVVLNSGSVLECMCIGTESIGGYLLTPRCRYRLNSGPKGWTPAECFEHVITIKLERVDKVACTQMPGVCARVIRHLTDKHQYGENPSVQHCSQDLDSMRNSREALSSANKQHVLLNTLHAKCESPLSSITRTLCRAEHASHLLVWGEYATDGHDPGEAHASVGASLGAEGAENGTRRAVCLACVDMTRLDAKFVVKNITNAAGKAAPALFSEVRSALVHVYMLFRWHIMWCSACKSIHTWFCSM